MQQMQQVKKRVVLQRRSARKSAAILFSMMSHGQIFFDAGCGMCSAGARRWQATVERAGFELIQLQDPRASEILGLAPGELPGEIKLRTRDGQIIGGVDAFAYVARYVWWAFPLHLWMAVSPVRELAKTAYLPIARNRQRISGVCGLRPMIAAQ